MFSRVSSAGADDGGGEHHVETRRVGGDDGRRVGRGAGRQAGHVELAWLALERFGYDAGAHGARDDDRLAQQVRRARCQHGAAAANAGDVLPGLEADLAARPAHFEQLRGRLDEVAGEDGGEELHLLVRAEEALVAVEPDEELGRRVAEEGEHARAVDQLARVMGVMGAHPNADEGLAPDHDRWISEGIALSAPRASRADERCETGRPPWRCWPRAAPRRQASTGASRGGPRQRRRPRRRRALLRKTLSTGPPMRMVPSAWAV